MCHVLNLESGSRFSVLVVFTVNFILYNYDGSMPFYAVSRFSIQSEVHRSLM